MEPVAFSRKRMVHLPTVVGFFAIIGIVLAEGCHSVDLGGHSFTIGTVKQGARIDVILNRFSQRSSLTRVAFDKGRVTVGADAKSIAGRSTVITYTGFLPWDHHKVMTPSPRVEDDATEEVQWWHRGPDGYTILGNGVCPAVHLNGHFIDSTALTSLVLSHTADLIEEDTHENNTQLVLVIPPYASFSERLELLSAAASADVQVPSLLSTSSAAVLSYLTGNFAKLQKILGDDKPHQVIVCDYGQTDTYCTLLELQRKSKERETTIKLLKSAHSNELTGHGIDASIEQLVIAQAGEPTTRVQADALQMSVNKLKHTLGAVNKVRAVTPYNESAGGVWVQDTDLAEIVDKAAMHVTTTLLEELGFGKKDERPDGFLGLIVVGGISRIAGVKAAVAAQEMELIPVNPEDAVATGSGFFAATLTKNFRAKESFIIREPFEGPEVIAVAGQPENSTDKEDTVTLSKLIYGNRKRVRFNRSGDFNFTLIARHNETEKRAETRVTGLSAAAKESCDSYEAVETGLRALFERFSETTAVDEEEVAQMNKKQRKKEAKKHEKEEQERQAAQQIVQRTLESLQARKAEFCMADNMSVTVMVGVSRTGDVSVDSATVRVSRVAPSGSLRFNENTTVARVLLAARAPANFTDSSLQAKAKNYSLPLNYTSTDRELTVSGGSVINFVVRNENAEQIVAAVRNMTSAEAEYSAAVNSLESLAYHSRDLAADMETALSKHNEESPMALLASSEILGTLQKAAEHAREQVEEVLYEKDCALVVSKENVNETEAFARLLQCTLDRAEHVRNITATINAEVEPVDVNIGLLKRIVSETKDIKSLQHQSEETRKRVGSQVSMLRSNESGNCTEHWIDDTIRATAQERLEQKQQEAQSEPEEVSEETPAESVLEEEPATESETESELSEETANESVEEEALTESTEPEAEAEQTEQTEEPEVPVVIPPAEPVILDIMDFVRPLLQQKEEYRACEAAFSRCTQADSLIILAETQEDELGVTVSKLELQVKPGQFVDKDARELLQLMQQQRDRLRSTMKRVSVLESQLSQQLQSQQKRLQLVAPGETAVEGNKTESEASQNKTNAGKDEL